MGQNQAAFDPKAKIIEVRVAGQQTKDSILALTKDAERAVTEASAHVDEVAILADASTLEQMDVVTEAAALRGMKVVSFDRLAIVVGNQQLRVALSALAKLSGKADMIQLFDDRSQAHDWLQVAA